MVVGLPVSDDTTRAFLSLYSPAEAVRRRSGRLGDIDETLSGSQSFALDHTVPVSSSNWMRTFREALDSNE